MNSIRVLTILVLLLAGPTLGAAPVAATTPSVTMFTNDGGMGGICAGYTYDANLGNGIAHGNGANCGGNWNNHIESLRFHFHSAGVCWIFYADQNYSGTRYIFHEGLEGDFELPAAWDNIFSSFSKGIDTKNNQSCAPIHP